MPTTKIDGSGVTFPDASVQPTRGAKIASGSYVGDDSVNKAIPHTLGVIPKLVILNQAGSGPMYFIVGGQGFIVIASGATVDSLAVTAPSDTNIYVGNAGSYTHSANSNGVTYYWVAIG